MDSPTSGIQRRPKWRITVNAKVTLAFAALCVLATIINFATNGAANRLVFTTYRSSLTDPLTYLRLFTHVLGHADFEHLMNNMTIILLLGPMLEEKYGPSTICGVILLSALCTSLVNALLFSNIALCGASGVCFSFILLSSFTSFTEGEIPLTFILVAVLFLGQQIINGIFVQDNISYLSHIIGGIVGAGVGFGLRPKRKTSIFS